MHYVFRGLRRGIGEPVTGRITAPNEDAVHEVLEAHAIIVDTLGPEEAGGLFPPLLEQALDDAGVRVTFNQMARVHEGHSVWVLDQDKIRGRVAQLAREALGGGEANRRIEQVLETLYGDKRPSPAPAAEPAAGAGRSADAEELRAEVQRLMTAINRLERELKSMRSTRPVEREPRRVKNNNGAPRDRTRDDVLHEIFQHNLELMKLTHGKGAAAAAG